MSTTENSKETKQPLERCLVSVPKETHKDAVIHLFSQALIYNYLEKSIGFDLTESMDDPSFMAMELMGGNQCLNNDRFTANVAVIVNHFSNFKSLPKDKFEVLKRGKKVYKAVKLEIEKYNLKLQPHV